MGGGYDYSVVNRRVDVRVTASACFLRVIWVNSFLPRQSKGKKRLRGLLTFCHNSLFTKPLEATGRTQGIRIGHQ
jgi:hypothetical protein